MDRLTRSVLAAGLGALAACTSVTHSAPAPADQHVLAELTATTDEMAAADTMLRDAFDRLVLSLDEPWRDRLGVALEELAAHFVDGNEQRARQALAETRDLVAAYDGPASGDLAAITLVLDRVAVLLGEQ